MALGLAVAVDSRQCGSLHDQPRVEHSMALGLAVAVDSRQCGSLHDQPRVEHSMALGLAVAVDMGQCSPEPNSGAPHEKLGLEKPQ